MKLNNLVISKFNARSVVNDDEIDSLSDSIKKHKLISKLVLRPGKEEGMYEVIAGQRRLKALQKAHGDEYELQPDDYVIMGELSDQDSYVLSLQENIQRRDLSPIDLNRAYLMLNQMGKKDKEIAMILKIAPHRLKRLANISLDINRIPEPAKQELSKPAPESKFNDLHWEKIRTIEDDEVVKDVVDFIVEHETPAKDVPTIIKAVKKQYEQDNVTPGASGSSDLGVAAGNDSPAVDSLSPIEYTHKGELVLEKHGDKEILKVIGKDEDNEIPIEHYLEYLRHPEKFKCYVTFKLKVKPID